MRRKPLFVFARSLTTEYAWSTPQIAYKVAVCPRGNLLYMRIYFTNNTNILKGIISQILKVIFGVFLTLYLLCLGHCIFDIFLSNFLKLSYALMSSCFCWIVKHFLVGVSGVLGVEGMPELRKSLLRRGLQSSSSLVRFLGVSPPWSCCMCSWKALSCSWNAFFLLQFLSL